MTCNNVENLKLMIEHASQVLSQEWNENPKLDAMILLAYAIGMYDYTEMFMCKFDKMNLPDDYVTQFESYINRRKLGEPIAYILNRKSFWKNDFYVNYDVLIPRPETEFLVEYVAKNAILMQERGIICDRCDILELGVGSGCVLISILNELRTVALQKARVVSHGVGIDISDVALRVAKRNAENILSSMQDITFLRGNWFDAKMLHRKFDFVISNPPYIPFSEWHVLSKEVKDFEPRISLTDMQDGLDAYRVISANAKQFLKDKGLVVVEVGYDKANAVISIFQNAGFKVKDIVMDLCNIERVVSFTSVDN
ncbi:peptide chain release factor N(5)-glutamine methyltransferase [Candidatus Fokinia solitaria]|nr:peptide chain release factor N(5)-glutamine methyltransferase [Candidatus Fokinia solitaria]